MENELICLCDRPELIETAAQWFHRKWGVPLAAYLESMNDSLTASAVPRWYVMLGGNGEIIGGLGVLLHGNRRRRGNAEQNVRT